jgi:hypothetical protein
MKNAEVQQVLTLEHKLDYIRERLEEGDMEPWRFRMLKTKLEAIERQVLELQRLCDDESSAKGDSTPRFRYNWLGSDESHDGDA